MPGTGLASLVPRAREVREADGPPFVWNTDTALVAEPAAHGVARWLRGHTVLPFREGLGAAGASAGTTVELRVDEGLDAEGYRLDVTPARVLIEGGDAAGVFWGAQTLRQVLPPAAFRRAGLPGQEWHVPRCHIEDAPRFGWRGMMLDVARHFMPKDGVLRLLDLLAAHKLNVFHFHLTDDQGWRMEIRRYPQLTETGAWRPRTRVGHRASPLWDERRHGGYYTQDDLREIVAYAAERHITVVPEIELPGHSQAAIAAYPDLGSTDVVDTAALGVWTDWGVSPHLLAPTDDVLRFYEHVLDEVLDVFPSPCVHLGGDETPKEEWRASAVAQARIAQEGLRDEDALQVWMVRHFDRWLAARGRRLVGWDEILDGGTLEGPGLTPGAVVSSWRGTDGGAAAAEAGHDVVMCPEHELYLDRRQAPGPDEPVPLGRVATLRDVYGFSPVPERLAAAGRGERVLGVQANMWTECAESAQRVDYQVFPRLAALAEVAWSGPGGSYDDFVERLVGAHLPRLDAAGVEYRPLDGPRPWQRRPGIPGRPLD
ncbi:beta-N-acetylhexosaminidase [Streptomyces reniochalinae]|uniref:beta-N-acetylhexosaminidase n=1 Tax=Streptomyces reniochalinae TaxID=2250578 RepID=A0A367F3R5_9ACTN|nr:beta-N-acetylhexosaminidase [Streptomyces reniochalinae]RCG24569.1 beta-N-acetylhexosaminidase [Streptomyces reniochalinae]